jgi:hypothetical protein
VLKVSFHRSTFEVLKIKAFTFVNNCFQYKSNAAIGHYGQTLFNLFLNQKHTYNQ